MSWLVKARFCFLLLLAVSLPGKPVLAGEPFWHVTGNAISAVLYKVAPKSGTVFSLSRTYYNVQDRAFLLDMALLSEAALSTPPHPSQHVIYRIYPETGQTHWLQTTVREDAFNDYVFAMPPYAETIFLSSSVLRETGERRFKQPFGNHVAVLRLEENPYDKRHYNTGLFGFGEPGWILEKRGRGRALFEVRSSGGAVLFTLEDHYNDNSREFTAFWSPDGRYVFIQMPPKTADVFVNLESFALDRFLIIGPFATQESFQTIMDQLSKKREARQTAFLNQEFASGAISAEDRYGALYLDAKNRVLRCAAVEDITGPISSLEISSPANVLNFGNPVIVGKHFMFDFTAVKARGRLQATAIESRLIDEWGDKYKNYLETVNIDTESNSYHVVCP